MLVKGFSSSSPALGMGSKTPHMPQLGWEAQGQISLCLPGGVVQVWGTLLCRYRLTLLCQYRLTMLGLLPVC